MPLHRACLYILLSTLLISGSALMGWLYFQHLKERRHQDSQYQIIAIIQSPSEGDSLRSVYLAELLGLSLDRPVNLYQFNIKEAVDKLQSHPLIKKAAIKKILPGTLYIQYQMRKPVAYAGDFSNTFIDADGYLFPCRPFYTSKRLPTLFLGLQQKECSWGSCVKDELLVKAAFEMMDKFKGFKQELYYLKQLDLVNAISDSYGKKQIVLLLEPISKVYQNLSIFVRLSPDHYLQDLANFTGLYSTLLAKNDPRLAKEKEIVVDLRIPHLAFIKPIL